MYKLLSEGTENRERGIYYRQMPGFLKGPKLAAVVRTLRMRKMYISRFNSLIMPFDLYFRQRQKKGKSAL